MRKLITVILICVLVAGLCSCSSGAKSADLSAVLGSFSLDEEEMLMLTADEMTSFYGIDPADMKQFAAAVNLSGIQCDEYVLVECVSDAALNRVSQALEKRLDQKKNEMKGYLPEQYDIITKCSVIKSGMYTAMIVSPDAQAQTKVYNDSFK